METQVCKCCGIEKPIEDFRLYKGVTRLTKCRTCEKEYMQNYKNASKKEKVLVIKSEKIMPVSVNETPELLPIKVMKTSYNIIKEGKTIVVDTTPKKNCRKVVSEDNSIVLFVPSGVSIFDLENA